MCCGGVERITHNSSGGWKLPPLISQAEVLQQLVFSVIYYSGGLCIFLDRFVIELPSLLVHKGLPINTYASLIPNKATTRSLSPRMKVIKPIVL